MSISPGEYEILMQRVKGNTYHKPAEPSPVKKNKLNAQRTEVDGITFASKKEAERYRELRLMASAGEIQNLVLQPRYEFPFNAHYTADFSYEIFGRLIVEEVKGIRTEAFQLRLKCFHYFYPHLRLLINGVESKPIQRRRLGKT